MIEKYVDADELKRLLSSLLVVLGGLVIAGLFASIVVPGLRNANQPETQTPVNPVVGEPGWLDLTEFPAEKGREIPPVDPQTLIASSEDQIIRGKNLFLTNCAPCHGNAGSGDGPAASTMNPRPRNFTSPDAWTNGFDLPGIFKTISEGVQGSSMAPFDYMPKTSRMALAHYVQSLGRFPHGPGSSEALEKLSENLKAPGGKTPNKIPVSMAMTKLEREFSAAPPIVIAPSDHTEGAELLRRVILNPARSAQTLAQSPAWRTGTQELAASILLAAPANGFSSTIATLNAKDWQLLEAELIARAGH